MEVDKNQKSIQPNVDEADHLLQFCDSQWKMIMNNQNNMFFIYFSEDCSFYLNGIVRRHNCSCWSASKINLWGAHQSVPKNLLLGGYHWKSQNARSSHITNLAIYWRTPFIQISCKYFRMQKKIIFQQDGASLHSVWKFLHDNFLTPRFKKRIDVK